MIKCAIFDYNGTTILDSEIQEQSWISYMSRLLNREVTVDEYKNYIHGQSNKKVFSHFLDREVSYEETVFYGNQKEQEYRDLCVEYKDTVTLARGIEKVWDYFKDNSVLLNIGTNAPMVNMTFAYDFYNLHQWFDIKDIVVDDGIIKTKPEPDTYVLAMEKMNARPEETIVFEDTILGVTSAIRAHVSNIVLMDYKNKVSEPLFVEGKQIMVYHNFSDVLSDLKKKMGDEPMRFTKDHADTRAFVDNVFPINTKAIEDYKKNGDIVVNATIGSLYDETGTIAVLDSVYNSYKEVDDHIKASYSSDVKGDPDFQKEVYKWVVGDRCDQLKHSVIATSGGSGAVGLTVLNFLNEQQELLIPDLAWGSYRLMADTFCLKTTVYSMFDGDHFNLSSFKENCEAIMARQNKLVAIINDPCHNPSGYSMTMEEWQSVIDVLNKCSEQGPVILLNDIAYIDYANQADARAYMKLFNQLNENVAVIIAFSCSKTLTAYGMRCGAAILLTKTQEGLEEMDNCMMRSCRAIWSNINHGFMVNFVELMKNHKEEFLKENKEYTELLKKRTDLFKKEADEVGLPYYPYKEGFFVTLKYTDKEERELFVKKMMEEHIYTLAINGGIRVALCSVPYRKVEGLAKRMKQIYDEKVK